MNIKMAELEHARSYNTCLCAHRQAGSPSGAVITILLVGSEFPEPLLVTILRLYSWFACRSLMVIEVMLVVSENTVLPDVVFRSSMVYPVTG